MTKVDIIGDKFNHWWDSLSWPDEYLLSPLNMEEAYRAGFEAGRDMERAMWELVRDDQEWEIDVDQNAFDHS